METLFLTAVMLVLVGIVVKAFVSNKKSSTTKTPIGGGGSGNIDNTNGAPINEEITKLQ